MPHGVKLPRIRLIIQDPNLSEVLAAQVLSALADPIFKVGTLSLVRLPQVLLLSWPPMLDILPGFSASHPKPEIGGFPAGKAACAGGLTPHSHWIPVLSEPGFLGSSLMSSN